MDAEKFLPPAGSLVAFRGLTVHRWSGRSLNAYTDLLGTVWYQENPEQVEGAEELKEWYEDKLLLEAAEGFPGLEASQEAERV